MSTPLVSVIMPVYNCERYAAEAVASVLGQTYPSIELVCVDDASTDGSLRVLDEFGKKITIVRNASNKGIAGARNAGLARAHGDYVAFADADDIWHPEKLAAQMRQFADDPALAISFCMLENFLSPDLSPETAAARSFPAGPIAGQISGTFVAKRARFDAVGPLDESYRSGEFIDWMARAREHGLRESMVPEVLYRRRIHATNTTLGASTHADYLKLAKAALDRRRAQKP